MISSNNLILDFLKVKKIGLRKTLQTTLVAAFATVLLAPLPILSATDEEPLISKEELARRLDLSNFDKVSDGIFRGSKPSKHDLGVLSKSGIKTIVNLRMPGKSVRQEEKAARENGMRYVHIPMGFGHPDNKSIEKALEVICDKENQPVYVHCLQGSDRTGVIVGAYRRLIDHWSFSKAYKEMHDHHFKPWLTGMKKTVRDCVRSARLVAVAQQDKPKSDEKPSKQLARNKDEQVDSPI